LEATETSEKEVLTGRSFCVSQWHRSQPTHQKRSTLTSRGRDLIVTAFRKHAGQMKRVFSELNPEELCALEEALKKIGKRAAALMEQS